MDSNLIRLTGLWMNESKDGKKYMSGAINPSARLFIFKNENKREGSKDPDYYAVIGPVEPKDQPKKEEKEETDDIPF